MPDSKSWMWLWADQQEIIHSLRTAVAVVVSLLIARLVRLPEEYWAGITTLIVMQSTLGAAWTISKQRLLGTALGAAMGALLAAYFGENVAIFGAGVFILGVICAWLHIERNAYRYAGITLAIVMLIAHTQPTWIIAIHRFLEISVGIAVGLALTAIWPEPQPDGV
jgi:uncharacterized membrane protein YgaE (UPF0421/DUF939 family)